MNTPFAVEAMRTFTASRWTLLCARLFGRRIVGHDGRFRVLLRSWRGKTYLVGFSEAATPAEPARD